MNASSLLRSMSLGKETRRPVHLKVLSSSVISAMALWMFGVGCSGKSTTQEAVERNTPFLKDGVIEFPERFAEREGITYVSVSSQPIAPTLQVTGVITWNARQVADVGARIQGRVKDLRKIEGDEVGVQEILATIESAEVGNAQAALLKAKAQEHVVENDAKRLTALAEAQIVPARDAEFAKAALEAAVAERVAAETAVHALGGNPDDPIGIIYVRSPISGRVVKAKARRGATFSADDTLFVVADGSTVWAELHVFERELSRVAVGDDVEVFVPSNPEARFLGKVDHVAEVIDPNLLAGKVRVALDNPTGALRAGLTVTANIRTNGVSEALPVVPKQAVTRIDGKPHVFVALAKGRVEPRPVELGASDTQYTAITKGVAGDDQIVLGGLTSLKAELFR